MNKNIILIPFFISMLFSLKVEAKKEQLQLSGNKVAVMFQIENAEKLSSNGVSVFGASSDVNNSRPYTFSEEVKDTLGYVLTDVGIDFEFVSMPEISEAETNGLKKRALRKVQKKHWNKFLTDQVEQGFSDLIYVTFRPVDLNKGYGYILPVINGFGLYKRAGNICAYHTLSLIHQSLFKKSKVAAYKLTQTIPEKAKPDHVCANGVNIRRKGITKIEKFNDYTSTEVRIIDQSINDLVLNSILDTFYRVGVIKNPVNLNKLYLKLKLSDYLLIEKLNDELFEIDGLAYNREEITQYLNQLSNQKKNIQVLLGHQTKSRFNFGDIKKIFLPPTQNSKVVLYRLGPDYQLIEI